MISPVEKWVSEATGLHEKLNPSALLTWQLEKLEEQIEYARRNSRFYRKKLPPSGPWENVPFTTITNLVNDSYEFLAVPQSEVVRVTTLPLPGFSEIKKRVFFTKKDLERTIDFFSAGMSTMVSRGGHVQILISSNSENSLGRLLKESLLRVGVSSGIPEKLTSVNQALKASKGADCLVGMPAEIYYMSKIDRKLCPGSVLLTADYVPRSVIESIREIWKCNIFTHYGHTELGFGCAVDCVRHDGLHTRVADHFIEIISPETGKHVQNGETGEIVITTLQNEAMPLIRYRAGDLSGIIERPCACGSSLHRLKRIEGRIENRITLGSDRTVSIHQLDELVFADPAVRGYQAFMSGNPDQPEVHLAIDSAGHVDTEGLQQALPPGLGLRVSYTACDPFNNRGKRRIQVE
ncbi:MAG: hypothetical protein PHD61_09130 [Bacteroidales bacterium]|nr:hypothetical protein [Lentimicrobiaceae bacterium]MDD5695448.1 hypothetical protein [Bacteroidales bacterium]